MKTKKKRKYTKRSTFWTEPLTGKQIETAEEVFESQDEDFVTTMVEVLTSNMKTRTKIETVHTLFAGR